MAVTVLTIFCQSGLFTAELSLLESTHQLAMFKESKLTLNTLPMDYSSRNVPTWSLSRKFATYPACSQRPETRLGQSDLPTKTNPQNIPIGYMNRLDTKKSNIKGRNHRYIDL